MTRRIFALFIFALVANVQIFATSPGKQKKIYKVYTNDTSAVEGLEVKFTPQLSLVGRSNKILIKTSDPQIATLSSAEVASGTEVTATLHDMGTAIITMISKENKRLRKSFQIMVLDSRKQNSNSLVTGQIAIKQRFQVPLLTSNPKLALLRFGLQDVVYESHAARLMWDAIPDPLTMKLNPSATKEDVMQVTPKGADSCHVFVRLPGKHKLLLVATNGLKKDTIASARIEAVGEALSSFTYTLRSEDFISSGP